MQAVVARRRLYISGYGKNNAPKAPAGCRSNAHGQREARRVWATPGHEPSSRTSSHPPPLRAEAKARSTIAVETRASAKVQAIGDPVRSAARKLPIAPPGV